MRKQQEVWLREHTDQVALPTMANVEPASGVVKFVEWLRSQHVPLRGKAIDIGCGKGRNTAYLASVGLNAEAIDYIEPALAVARQLAHDRGFTDRIEFIQSEIDQRWPFDDCTFDLAVDSFSSIDIETLHGREIYRDELLRTLKPGGYALVTVVSADDEWERERIASHPGPEPHSTVWPETGKFQKDYTEPELRQFYAPFEIVAIRTIEKPTFKLGRSGTA